LRRLAGQLVTNTLCSDDLSRFLMRKTSSRDKNQGNGDMFAKHPL